MTAVELRVQSIPVTLVIHKQVGGRTKALSWVFSNEVGALAVARAIRDEAWLIVRGGFATAREAIEAAKSGGQIRKYDPSSEDNQTIEDSRVFTRESVHLG